MRLVLWRGLIVAGEFLEFGFALVEEPVEVFLERHLWLVVEFVQGVVVEA